MKKMQRLKQLASVPLAVSLATIGFYLVGTVLLANLWNLSIPKQLLNVLLLILVVCFLVDIAWQMNRQRTNIAFKTFFLNIELPMDSIISYRYKRCWYYLLDAVIISIGLYIADTIFYHNSLDILASLLVLPFIIACTFSLHYLSVETIILMKEH